MNALVAILGLGVLIFFHELGHFVVARAVGMRPRKFYVGFPPALVKTTRNGIEYGIGSIPLGGYVKIPGMHRPAASDLDLHMHRALEEAPQLVARVDRVKRALSAADFELAKTLLPDLARAVEEAELSERARTGAERGLRELEEEPGEIAQIRIGQQHDVAARAGVTSVRPTLRNVLLAPKGDRAVATTTGLDVNPSTVVKRRFAAPRVASGCCHARAPLIESLDAAARPRIKAPF